MDLRDLPSALVPALPLVWLIHSVAHLVRELFQLRGHVVPSLRRLSREP